MNFPGKSGQGNVALGRSVLGRSMHLINGVSYAKYILVGAIAAILLIPSAFVSAGSGDPGGSVISPSGELCVEGVVIDHEEMPLDDGWIIVATPYNDAGILDPGGAIGAVSSTDEDEAGEFKFEEGLFPGNWQFAVELKEGWEPVTADRFDVPLRYGMEECRRIRFKLRQVVTVHVIKINDDHHPLADWIITATPGAENRFAEAVAIETGADGVASFRLTPGKWVFTEEPPEDFDYAFNPVIPVTGKQEVDVEGPGPLTIRFKNRIKKTACIEVYKYDIPPTKDGEPFGLAGWHIDVQRADGTVQAYGKTDAFGNIVFDNLPPGPYTVVEESRVGWDSVTPSALDVTVTGSSHCQVVTFYNQQTEPQFCIEGRKVDLNGGYGLPGWEITAEPLDAGDPEVDAVLTNGLGEYKFVFPSNDYRVPGSRYEVCEEEQDGWRNHSPLCRVVTLPYEPGMCTVVSDFENYQVGHYSTPTPQEPVSMPYKPAPADSGCRTLHTVKTGESLASIGKYYGVGYSMMLEHNKWVYKHPQHWVEIGQTVCIPVW
ncbi:MAG: SpaA isopeptide-forming pilin-related protein [Chloroflexota bacterium]